MIWGTPPKRDIKRKCCGIIEHFSNILNLGIGFQSVPLAKVQRRQVTD
jgi:hypothetical protein